MRFGPFSKCKNPDALQNQSDKLCIHTDPINALLQVRQKPLHRNPLSIITFRDQAREG